MDAKKEKKSKEKKASSKKDKKDKKDKKAKEPSKAASPAIPSSALTPGGPAPPPPREPQLGETSVTEGLLTVHIIPECPHVLRGINSDLNVVIELVTGARPDRKARPPLSLAIVLDKSGSMAGAKLRESKAAVVEVIRNLSKDDVVHFIAYDTSLEVVFENGSPSDAEHLISLVAKVQDGSSTFLSGGLDMGGTILKRNQRPGHVNKIFVFSDGLANSGITDDAGLFALAKKIHDGGISTSAFGIGADFSENTMRGIAEHGSGHYFYLNEPANIPKYVAKALNDSLMVLGQNTVLKLRGRGPAVLKKVYDHPDLVAGAQLKDLRESNLRQITAVFGVSPNANAPAEEEIMTWELSYQTAENGTKTLKGVFSIKFTDDENLLKQKNDEVTVATAMQEAASRDPQVTDLINAGRYDEAFIQKNLSLQLLKEVADKDKKGFISILIKRAESHLADIKAKKDPVKISLAMGYDGYLQRRASICAMHELDIANNAPLDLIDTPSGTPPRIAPARHQRRLS